MWRVEQHTADVRLVVRAATLGERFADAVRGLAEVMHPLRASGERVEATIVMDAVDTTALLVDFLNDVLTRAHIERVAFTATDFAELRETALRATVAGVRCGGFGEDVKSVTYHEANVSRHGHEWGVTLVLDI